MNQDQKQFYAPVKTSAMAVQIMDDLEFIAWINTPEGEAWLDEMAAEGDERQCRSEWRGW